jgi:YVTN family beta-propeller protein
MKKMMTIISCILLATNFYCFGQNESSHYRIANRFPVEGDGFWDYLIMEENTGRLFISHSSVTQVLDSKTGKLVGTIENTNGVHGIALDQEDNKAFISCGRDSSVVVVNLTTLEFITKIKVTGANPDAILYDKFSDKVFVYNGRSSNATVIDAKTNEVVATIPLAGKPENTVSDGNGKVYVNIEDKSLITVIDSRTLKVLDTWSLAPGEEPSGMALDNITHRLFSVCGNKKMVVMDAQNGEIITTLDIGEGTDGCAFDPKLKRAYSSNGEGTLTTVQEENANKFSVLNTLPTQRGARTIGLDKKTHHIYLPTAEFGPAPEATAVNPRPRPAMLPGTFMIMDVVPE